MEAMPLPAARVVAAGMDHKRNGRQSRLAASKMIYNQTLSSRSSDGELDTPAAAARRSVSHGCEAAAWSTKK